MHVNRACIKLKKYIVTQQQKSVIFRLLKLKMDICNYDNKQNKINKEGRMKSCLFMMQ